MKTSMAQPQDRFDAAQLGRIAKTCTRWSGVTSLPTSLRCRLEQLDGLSQRLLAQNGGEDADTGRVLALVRENCRAIRKEFAQIQVSFVCPSCPLRAD